MELAPFERMGLEVPAIYKVVRGKGYVRFEGEEEVKLKVLSREEVIDAEYGGLELMRRFGQVGSGWRHGCAKGKWQGRASKCKYCMAALGGGGSVLGFQKRSVLW